jgi:hypothetical protein
MDNDSITELENLKGSLVISVNSVKGSIGETTRITMINRMLSSFNSNRNQEYSELLIDEKSASNSRIARKRISDYQVGEAKEEYN